MDEQIEALQTKPVFQWNEELARKVLSDYNATRFLVDADGTLHALGESVQILVADCTIAELCDPTFGD